MYPFSNKQDEIAIDPSMLGMPKQIDPFSQSKEFYLGSQPSLKDNPDILINLFSNDKTMRDLVMKFYGKYYDPESKKWVAIGTGHMNEMGIKELIPMLGIWVNDSVTKARLDFVNVENISFNARLRIDIWLAINRKRFAINKDSITFISQVLDDFIFTQCTRAIDREEARNLLENTIKHVEGNKPDQSKSYLDKLLQPKLSNSF